jgi:hypothetical protein
MNSWLEKLQKLAGHTWLAFSRSESRPWNIRKLNRRALADFRDFFEVIEFRKLVVEDEYDLRWGWWSRIFEYPFIIETLHKYFEPEVIRLHNTSWGFEGVHIEFREELERTLREVVSSDILPYPGCEVYDVTQPPKEEWLESFDCVINVSTVEEVPSSHLEIIGNLLSMVKLGGILAITFDLPGMQLKDLETSIGQTISLASNPVTGKSSPLPMPAYSQLEVGVLVVRRVRSSTSG